jgi:hypothetical protein
MDDFAVNLEHPKDKKERRSASGITAGAFATEFGEAHIAAISHLIDRDPFKDPTAEQIACRLREEMAMRNPFGQKAKHQHLAYAPHLLLGR